MKSATNDTKTVSYMQSVSDGGVILYGATHFGDYNGGDSMRALLPQNGKAMAVMDIFLNASRKQSDDDSAGRAQLKKADAAIYINPPANLPNGIEIINPELQPVYDEAVRNVKTASKLTM